RRRSRWCANGSSGISARRVGSRTRPKAPVRSAAFWGPFRRCSPAPRNLPISLMLRPGTASCWPPKPLPRSVGPRRGAIAGPLLRCGSSLHCSPSSPLSSSLAPAARTAYNDCIAIIVVCAMGSLTVRNVGNDVKQRLRMRAARHGRSMEEEIRHILADADAGRTPVTAPAVAGSIQNRSTRTIPDVTGEHHATLATHRILLVIGGGIAAYKSLDLIRRLRER